LRQVADRPPSGVGVRVHRRARPSRDGVPHLFGQAPTTALSGGMAASGVLIGGVAAPG
jgi:hypothetical protein